LRRLLSLSYGFKYRLKKNLNNPKSGMELVQVAILIAIAITIGLLFRTQIEKFVNRTFSSLLKADF